MMSLIKLNPAFKDYIWGGTRLKTDFGKQTDLEPLAESWELSCHNDGQSTIADGEYAGQTLSDFFRDNPDFFGSAVSKYKDFPILIKLIDARDRLSIQVHPDDEYARRFEGGFGKTEMWYVVDCKEKSALICGFKHKISRDEFRRRINNNTLDEVLDTIEVKKGDVFFIEAGTIHGIGSGILIAEIQQSSNLTYRVYDYGRVGKDGNPRELHIDKAVDVTVLKPKKRSASFERQKITGGFIRRLAECKYFEVDELKTEDTVSRRVGDDSMNSILFVEGSGVIISQNRSYQYKKGDSFVVAAGNEYSISGKSVSLITKIV